MKKASLIGACLCALIAALPATAAAESGTPIPGQYIVVLEDGADGRGVASEHARSAGAKVAHTYDAAVHGYAAQLDAAGLAKVKADRRVAAVVQDREGDPLGADMLPTGINRVDAELGQSVALATMAEDGTTTTPDPGTVAVMDTGIDTSHPDLTVAGGVNCLGAKNSYNDGTINDKQGHGTHIAGIIGAKENGFGIEGVAPGVNLQSVRTNDSLGVSSTSRQLCGINWVTENAAALGIKVVNSSQTLIGATGQGTCTSDVLHQAICNSTAAGVTWVFSAMNSTRDFKDVSGASWDEVLTVTAMADSNGQPNVGSTAKFSCKAVMSGASGTSGVDDTTATFSNWAVTTADQVHTVAAPGVCIYSTWKGSAYGYLSGTSMAAPHVAATVHRCIRSGQCVGTPAEIIQKVRGDAAAYNQANPKYGFKGDPLRPTTGRYMGYLVNAAAY
jgi:subtilisin family serine protease